MRARIDYDEAEFRRMWEAEETADAIADRFGSGLDWVWKKARAMGINRAPLRGSKIDEDELRRLCSAGLTWEQIGDALGVSNEGARSRATALGIKKSPAPRHDLNAANFRRMWNEGLSAYEIAQRMGISEGSVYQRARRAGLAKRCGGIVRAGDTYSRKYESKPEYDPKPAKPEPVMRKCPHPNWPVMLDLKVFATAGKYAAIAELAKETGRPIAAIQGRWHLVGGR